MSNPLVDIHTHVYLPRYAQVLRSRATVPRILTREDGEERLVILDNEPSGGRPVGPQYWAREEKLRFMDLHGIDISVVRCVPLPVARAIAEGKMQHRKPLARLLRCGGGAHDRQAAER